MARFTLTMHPAAEGDALTLSWGDGDNARHALIDLGRTRSFKALKPFLVATRHFELFVMTHIDADHIEGAMPFVREAVPAFEPTDVWFNGYQHLATAKMSEAQTYETFSPLQGEKLSEGIRRFGWAARWNAAFGGGPVSIDTPGGTDPKHLAGGLTIRLLSPSTEELVSLEKVWREDIERLGLLPGTPDPVAVDRGRLEKFGGPDVEKLASERFREDTAPANGSSIAFLAEFDARRVLLTGDSHPGRLEASLRALGLSETNRLKLDCFKLSHHGSKANTSPSILGIVDCTRFAISTDGTKNDHPDQQTIARILAADRNRPKQLIFNFRQPHSTIWNRADLMTQWNYTCIFPDDQEAGVMIDI